MKLLLWAGDGRDLGGGHPRGGEGLPHLPPRLPHRLSLLSCARVPPCLALGLPSDSFLPHSRSHGRGLYLEAVLGQDSAPGSQAGEEGDLRDRGQRQVSQPVARVARKGSS